MSCDDGVGLSSGDLSFAITNHYRMGDNSDKPVNVGTHVDLNHVTILEHVIGLTR